MAQLAVVLVLGVASSAALPASADRNSLNDKKRQQQQVRQQRALIASQIDTLKASDRQIDSALKAINANVQGTQAELESAQRALDQANHDAAVARQGIEDATSSITQLQTTLAGLAVDSYVHPLGDTMLAVLNTTNISDAAQKRAFLTVVHQRDADVADQIKQAREDLTVQQQLAEDAAARGGKPSDDHRRAREAASRASSSSSNSRTRCSSGSTPRSPKSRCSSRRTSSSRHEIAKEQAAIAAQLRRRGGGRGTALPPIGNIERRQRGRHLRRRLDRGQRVALLDAAAADGVPLSGWGYRDTSAQVALQTGALRRQPVRGLRDAVVPVPSPDRAAGRVDARTRPRDRLHLWRHHDREPQQPVLQVAVGSHASQYGLYNLPSEPWHWSTNGN